MKKISMVDNSISQICDTFPESICLTDRQGGILLVNQKYTEMTGLSHAELVGKNVEQLVLMGLFDTVVNPAVLRDRRPVSCVQRISNGRTVVLSGHPLFDSAGEIEYVVTFIRDITSLSNLKNDILYQKALLGVFLEVNPKEDAQPIVIQSQTMCRLHKEVCLIANTDASVLLLGETGVGKEVIARSICQLSGRRNGAFIKVDCGAIPENIIETELFGYVGGAFSGADIKGKVGLIEAANGGTIFFDEIGELPLHVQTKLLRFLQDKEIMRVGGTTEKVINTRVIAATNHDLADAVKKGTFRSDLFYRLNVATVNIPPLRQRVDDLMPMATYFLRHFNSFYRKNVQFTPEALAALTRYSWPGNVRELKNLVQGMVITTEGSTINVADLPISVDPQGASGPFMLSPPKIDLKGKSLKHIMQQLESEVIEAGIERYGSVSKAAQFLGIDRSTMFRKRNAP